MAETLAEIPSMNPEERKGFIGRLLEKLSFVRGLQESGLNVKAAEEAVEQQIRDTVTTGDPQKA